MDHQVQTMWRSQSSDIAQPPYAVWVMDCGKKRYATKYEAERVAAHQKLENRAPNLRVYRCPDCGGWHLTKQPI